MTPNQKKLPFTQLMVSIMPKKSGTYTLWNKNGKIIFIGKANKPNSLYNELKDHFDNEHATPIKGIYDFQVNVCNNPGDQQRLQLKKLEDNLGYRPDYNREQSMTNNKEGNAYS